MTKMVLRTLRVDPDMWDMAMEAAADRGENLSAALRAFLENYGSTVRAVRAVPGDWRTLIWSTVSKHPRGCWLWTGSTDRKGYGRMWVDGRWQFAHRLMWGLAVGELEPTQQLDHRCRTRNCVRPAHLRIATSKENNENQGGAQRNNKSSGIRGVHWHKGGQCWRVQVQHAGINHHGGTFRDVNEAEQAAIALRNRLFTHNDADRARVGADQPGTRTHPDDHGAD